jgi:hypothetical protein
MGMLNQQEEQMPELPLFDTIPANVLTTSSVTVSAGPNGIGSNTGIIHSAGDQDWFRISLRAGELYQFQLNSTSGVDPTLALHNAAGVQVAFDDDSGPGLNSLLTYRAPTAGNYYLDAGGYSSSVGSYSVVAREVPATTATYASVGINTSVQGDIQDANDQDYYAVSLVAGQSYIFDVDGTTLSDPTLALRNSVGTQLAFNDDGGPGFDSRIEFTAGSSGMYFLDVGGYSSNTGSYSLATRIDDAADDIYTLDSIAANGVMSGQINSAADQDFFESSWSRVRTTPLTRLESALPTRHWRCATAPALNWRSTTMVVPVSIRISASPLPVPVPTTWMSVATLERPGPTICLAEPPYSAFLSDPVNPWVSRAS